MSLSITLDKASLDHLDQQFKILKEAGPRSVYSAVLKVAYKIASDAKLRLRGKNHIVTSRLRNSLFVKTKDKASEGYQDKDGKSFVAELPSVSVTVNEVAIGTNVEYAEKIENLDSYLYWATQNIDIAKSIGDEAKPTLENAMKYGKGIIPVTK
jgi:hypothetical protein